MICASYSVRENSLFHTNKGHVHCLYSCLHLPMIFKGPKNWTEPVVYLRFSQGT